MKRRLCIALLSSVTAAAAAQPVVLHYNERPPYLVLKEGQLTGLTGAPAVAAFKAAGVPFTVAATPAARQMEIVRNNAGTDCAVGWFRNPERERFAKYTGPIYQDEPQVALVAAGNARLKSGDTLEKVLGDRNLVLLVKQSYSYGRRLDELIERLQPAVESVVHENTAMVRMIQAGRADYMFIAPEEAAGIVAAAGLKPDELRQVSFANAPRGERRYIMCSRNVPDEVIARLNAALR